MNSTALRITTRIAVILIGLGMVIHPTSTFSSNPKRGDLAPAQKLELSRAMQVARAIHPAQHSAILQKSTARSATVQVDSTGFGAIAGTVRTTDGDSLLSGYVAAYIADSSQALWRGFAKLNPDGFYLIEQLIPGEYFVVAQADNYLPQYYDHASSPADAQLVSVAEGDTTIRIDFTLQRIAEGKGSISGRVTNATDGSAIANATVYAYSLDNPFIYVRGVAVNDGMYRIFGLLSGKYIVVVWAEGFLTEYYDNARTPELAAPVTVNEPNETGNIDFALSTGSTISGHVSDLSGNPLSGVLIEAFIAATDSGTRYGYGRAYSDFDGSYKIIGLEAGAYLAVAYGWNQWSYDQEWFEHADSPDQATPINVLEGQATNNIDFTLDLPKAAGTIGGVVTNLQGEPLPGVYVQANSWYPVPDSTGRNRGYWGYAQTDAGGRYRIELPADAYLVSAYAYSMWQYVVQWYPGVSSSDSAERVVVEQNTNRDDVNFRLPLQAGTNLISGKVSAIDGRPLAGASIDVTFVNQDPNGGIGIWAYAVTDSSGNYRVADLPPGEYVAHAQYWESYTFDEQWYLNAENRAAATPIVLGEGQKADKIDFTLQPRPIYGHIFGRVTADADGAPVDRAYVEISPLRNDSLSFAPILWWSWISITDEKGQYRLDYLPKGDYLVSVHSNGAFEYYKDAIVPELATVVKVVGGDSTQIDFGMSPRNDGSGIIAGTVRDEWSNSPLSIAIVVARPVVTVLSWPESEAFYTAISDTLGNYTLAGLAPGDYYVMSFAPWYVGEYYDNVFDPSEATVVKVDGQQPVEGIHFALTPMLFLRDPAVDNGSGGGVFGHVTESSGEGVIGAHVYLLNEAGQAVAFGRTGAKGYYEISGTPPGQYRMLASHLEYRSEYNGDALDFSTAQPVEVGINKREVDFVLSPKVQTGVDGREASIPKTLELYGNYPNPFNPETRISFGLPALMRVKVRVFNLLGEEVSVLVDDMRPAGIQRIEWNGRDRRGREVGSGLYFYRVETAQGVLHGKMLLMR